MIEKVIRGVLRYSASLSSANKTLYAQVAEKVQPSCIFITCMDSRVFPSNIASIAPGESFIVRNAGNIVPHSKLIYERWTPAEAAALELACVRNQVSSVVVCGHSDCKAMDGLHSLGGTAPSESSFVLDWIYRFASQTYTKWEKTTLVDRSNSDQPLHLEFNENGLKFEANINQNLLPKDQLSQINTLQQLLHVNSYSFMKEKIAAGTVKLYSLWFDIKDATCYVFNKRDKLFQPIVSEEMLKSVSEFQINQK
ncbi:uncharacterized protein TRIADDRAFT_29634 [Trichoplax adhaerens]|uniref:Carbonic anhydrase n=1 Tax=Trichoplax adhaerens TaxID=10228 RepID=B3S5Y1_TRIAD|nr:hypothetical protein TRIADDRAFT_29634 [Trichoplax adhaerens]EDV21991.1 hypothetical protein TRIADDRAFT_29634 [Trichoplax adhaerens]|eukprot:XP_002115628.1 hypothetical protein TRIADDRAFT_29634 [Trichoplax adhaerens]